MGKVESAGMLVGQDAEPEVLEHGQEDLEQPTGQSQPEASRSSQQPAERETAAWQSCLPDLHTCENDDRRYTLLITEVVESLEGSVQVGGRLHGCMHTGDTVWLIAPFGGYRRTQVTEMTIETDEGDVQAESAEDRTVELTLADVQPGEMKLFTVLTGICPLEEGNACENPDVLGRGYGFLFYQGNPLYKEALLYAIAHGRYVVPLRKKDSLYMNTEELIFSEKDSFIRLRHPMDEKKQVLPVFTDWQEMQGWEDVITKREAIETLTLTFEELASIVTDGRDDDLAINLFCGHPLIMSADMVCDVQLLGYVSPESGEKLYS